MITGRRLLAGAFALLVVAVTGCSTGSGAASPSTSLGGGTASPSASSGRANSKTVTKAEFGEAWPLKVDSAILRCEPNHTVTAEVDGVVYGVTVEAIQDGAADPMPIWDVGGASPHGLKPLQDAGLLLCSGDTAVTKSACDLLTPDEIADLAGSPMSAMGPQSTVFPGVSGCSWGSLENGVVVVSASGDRYLKYLLEASKGSESVMGKALTPDQRQRLDDLRASVSAGGDLSPEEGCAAYSELLVSQGQPPATEPKVVVATGQGYPDRALVAQCVNGRYTALTVTGSNLASSPNLSQRVEAALSAAHNAASA